MFRLPPPPLCLNSIIPVAIALLESLYFCVFAWLSNLGFLGSDRVIMFFNPTQPTVPLAGKTLVVPVVSTANVSQLSADLLIATLSLERIGICDSSFLIPALGAREHGPGVSTPLECTCTRLELGIERLRMLGVVYGKAGLDVVVVQQRSPALKSQKQEFVDALLDFVNTSGFAAALFLSGVDLSNRTDSQMLTPTYHLRPTGAAPDLSVYITRTSCAATHPRRIRPRYLSTRSNSRIRKIPLRTSRSSQAAASPRRIFQTISRSPPSSVATAGFLQFVLEGDNRADAALLASAVIAVLGLQVPGFKEPDSWKRGLFGAPPDASLYD
ncbi:PAC2 family-domain-containing protein [Mycena amicta]|nr:PAC2 family-domain-containing protein [Mycena amicta]